MVERNITLVLGFVSDIMFGMYVKCFNDVVRLYCTVSSCQFGAAADLSYDKNVHFVRSFLMTF
jgi:hypothetical protein